MADSSTIFGNIERISDAVDTIKTNLYKIGLDVTSSDKHIDDIATDLDNYDYRKTIHICTDRSETPSTDIYDIIFFNE